MSSIHFLTPAIYQPYIWGTCILLFFFLVFLLFQNKKLSFLGLRLLLTFLMVAALLMLGLQPAFTTQKEKTKLLLLTEDYDTNLLQKLQSQYKNAQTLEYENTIDFSVYLAETDSLFILGNGLPLSDLTAFKDFKIRLLLNKKPDGIQQIEFTKRGTVYEDFLVNGSIKNNKTESQNLVFSPIGQSKNSIKIAPNSVQEFSFVYTPKQAGDFLNSLVLKDSLSNVLEQENLPIVVKSTEKLSILQLNSFPNFESNALKKWLKKEGHQVLVRSNISKDKYRYDFINQKRFEWKKLTNSLLQKMDLVLLDAQSFKQLSTNEQQRLTKAIKKGLSLFVWSDQVDLLENITNQERLFKPLSLQRSKSLESIISLKGMPLKVKTFPAQIQRKNKIIPILQDCYNNNLAAFYRLELGKVGLSLLAETYPFILEGKQETYQNLWSKILEAFTEKNIEENVWSSNQSPLIFPNEPTLLQLNSMKDNPIGQVYFEDSLVSELSLKQDAFIPSKWSGTFWFEQSGWHSLSSNQNDLRQPFYVFQKDSWKSLKIGRQMEQMQAWHQKQKSRTFDVIVDYTYELIPLYWWYGLFLLSVGLLWLVEKIR